MNSAPNWPEGVTRRAALDLLGGLILLAMIPENPVVGGTVLRRAAIASPNFATGLTGWSINQDGSAEFNNLVIRNGQIISGTAFYYSGPPAAGNLIGSIAASAGTDNKGNQYLAGFSEYAPGASAIQLLNGQLNFYFFTTSWQLQTTFTGEILTIPSTDTFFLKVGALDAFDVSLSVADFNVLLNAAKGITVSGGTADSVVLTGGTATASPVSATQAVTSTNAAAIFRAVAVALTQQQIFFGGQVSGDSAFRLSMGVDPSGFPTIRFGGGSAVADAILIRPSAHLLQLTNADYDIATAGRGLQIAEGANAKMGTATLNGTTGVVVSTTAVTANSRIFLTTQTASGTLGCPVVASRVAGTSFTIKSTVAGDVSTVAWLLVEPG